MNEPPKITRIQFTKLQFMSLPIGIREMMLRLGWLTNDILFFQRLWLATMNFDPQSVAAKDASGSHNITLMLTLLGKVFEGTRIIEKWFFSAKESRDVLTTLKEEQLNTVNSLKKLMSNTSRLRRIRDQFTSHYSIEDPISPMMQLIDDETILSLYLGDPDGNSLRAYALQAMLSEIEELIAPNSNPPRKSSTSDGDSTTDPLIGISNEFIRHLNILLTAIEEYALRKIFPDVVPTETLDIPDQDYSRGVDIKFPPLVARPIPFVTK